MTTALHVLEIDGALGVAQLGSVCLIVWRDAVTPQRFERQHAALEAVAAQHPGHAGMICVVEASSPPPDPRLRRASIEMVANLRGRLARVACVIEGSGFRAATVRSVLSGMALLLASQEPEVKFTSTVAAAAAFVAERCDGVSATGLGQALAQLRAQMPAPAASEAGGSRLAP